jgi:hypothetical protein
MGIVPGATYSFGATLRIASSGSAAGKAYVGLAFHAASDCSDASTGGVPPVLSNPPGPTDTWVPLTGSAVAPAGATSVELVSILENDGALPSSASRIRPEAAVTTFDVGIDDFFLNRTAPADVGSILSGAHESRATLVGGGSTLLAGNAAGSASGVYSFSFNVTNLDDKSLEGHLSSHTILFTPDTDHTKIADIDRAVTWLVDVQCVEVSGNTAWWSGRVFFYTRDPRFNAATNTQVQNDVATSRYIVGGKIIGGVPEKRSLFITGGTVPEVSLNDGGSLNGVLLPMLGTSGAAYCKLHDGMFAGNADFLQLDTVNTGSANQSTNCVTGRPPNAGEVLCDIQWLKPDDITPVAFAPNTPATFATPPPDSLYDQSSVTRDIGVGSVVIGP